jgi:hypothetical protein
LPKPGDASYSLFCPTDCPRRHASELFDACAEVTFADDSVPPILRLGFVAGELHGDAPRDAGPFEVPNGGLSQIVRDHWLIGGATALALAALALLAYHFGVVS